MSSPQSLSYIVVGAGVFGTSTALHLKLQYPDADVTLVDRHDPDALTRPAASWDWNKVVRADYRDLTYCKSEDLGMISTLISPFLWVFFDVASLF